MNIITGKPAVWCISMMVISCMVFQPVCACLFLAPAGWTSTEKLERQPRKKPNVSEIKKPPLNKEAIIVFKSISGYSAQYKFNELQQSIEHFPKDTAIYDVFIRACIEIRRYDLAEKYAIRFIEMLRKEYEWEYFDYAQYNIFIGYALLLEIYLRIQAYEKAFASVNAQMAIYWDDKIAYQGKFIILFRMQRYDDALDSVNEYIRLFGEDTYTDKNLMAVYLKMHRINEAIDIGKKRLEKDKESILCYTDLIDALLKDKQYKEAERLADQQMRKFPKQRDGHENKHRILRVQEKYTEDEEHARTFLEQNPNNKSGIDALCVSLQLQGKFEKALEIAEQQISLDPDAVEGYNNTIGILTAQKEFEKARSLAHFMKKNDKMDKKPDGYENEIKAFYAEDDFDNSFIAAREFMVPFGYPYPVFNIHAFKASYAMGNFKDALFFAQKYKEFSPYDPLGYILEVFAHKRLNSIDKAIHCARLTKERFNYSYEAHRAYWQMLYETGDFGAAWEEAAGMASKFPDIPDRYRCQIQTLYAWGVDIFILENRKKAEDLIRDKSQHIATEAGKLYLHLSNELSAIWRGTWQQCKSYKKAERFDKIIENISNNRIVGINGAKDTYAEKELFFRHMFPARLTSSDVHTIAREVMDIINSSISISLLPDNTRIPWWPKNMHVVYLNEDDPEKRRRVVVITDRNGYIVDLYQTSGPDSASVDNGMKISLESVPLLDKIASVPNKNSGIHIMLVEGNSRYKGLQRVLNWKNIADLSCTEREQLLWLSAEHGELHWQDEEFEYYKYIIPEKYVKWRKKIKINEVYLKVRKMGNKSGEIIHLISPGQMQFEKDKNISTINTIGPRMLQTSE